ncbi:MAG: flavin oxidoreductase [Candidatus Marinimicrobia bacterium]|nr:flavin oxidoreductase [Candidatus Neomarinimicrobiota bacterium]
MYLSKNDIENLEFTFRINIINSITGIKPANLIGTISDKGITNLAIFSSVVHIGSNPALIGMFSRPMKKVKRNTFSNILKTQFYTINHVNENIYEGAHKTSIKYGKNISEFKECNFEEEYLNNFKAPFVRESNIKIGMKYVEHKDIKINNTVLIIGEVQNITLPDSAVSSTGYINLENSKSTGISGCNTYYAVKKIKDLSYIENELKKK